MGIDSGLHNFRSICNLAVFQLVDMLSVVFLCGKKKDIHLEEPACLQAWKLIYKAGAALYKMSGWHSYW